MMKKINLNSLRIDIFNSAKKHIVLNGWNDNLFSSIAKNSKFKEEEIRALFPKGYKSLLEFYLHKSNQEMIMASKKIDLERIKTNERIREIIIMKLKISDKEKKLVRRTMFTLMLPQHTKIATSSIYNTVNQIWYLAGDNSTDFNFYTKRIILSGIYCSTLFYWINKQNGSIELTKIFLDNQLKKIRKFSKLKKNLNIFSDLAMNIFSVAKNFSKTRQ